MVELRRIGHDNWLECIALSVTQEQQRFVNPNIFSLAEAFVHSDANPAEAEAYYRCMPYAIYAQGKMVGFVMATWETESDFDGQPAYEVYRLMIDQAHQGRSYGRQAVQALLAMLAEMPCGHAAYVYAQWHPENTASAQLFAGCGFTVVQAGEEILARRKL